MKIHIKTEKEIQIMSEGGKILADVLNKISNYAKEGLSTFEIDKYAEKIIKEHNAIAGFKGYQGFPGSICTAINEVIVHGIPKKDEILKNGDLFTIDCGVFYKKMHTDAARSIIIGDKTKASKEKLLLIKTAQKALDKAIEIAKPGVLLNKIGKVIQEIIEKEGYHIIKDLTGHGIGYNLHEDPVVLNYWNKKDKTVLKEGMTLAIEPIFSIGTEEMITLSDNWSLATKDNSCAVQVENTIVIRQNKNKILTI